LTKSPVTILPVHIKGAKVQGNKSSLELPFPGVERPGNERAMEWIGQGVKSPGNELARERISQGPPVGRFSPGSKLTRKQKGLVPKYVKGLTVICPIPSPLCWLILFFSVLL